MTPEQVGQTAVLLKRGFGCEDIGVKLGLDVHEVRWRINGWRKSGCLHNICGTSKVKNRRALQIMGVQRCLIG